MVCFIFIQILIEHFAQLVLQQLKKKYGENCTLFYTDTYSLIVDIKTEDAYKDLSETKD